MYNNIDVWESRKLEAQASAKRRTYRDVEYRQIRELGKNVLVDVHCKQTGHWLGRFEILFPHYKDGCLTESAHNYMEYRLIKNKVISPKECDLDELLIASYGL